MNRRDLIEKDWKNIVFVYLNLYGLHETRWAVATVAVAYKNGYYYTAVTVCSPSDVFSKRPRRLPSGEWEPGGRVRAVRRLGLDATVHRTTAKTPPQGKRPPIEEAVALAEVAVQKFLATNKPNWWGLNCRVELRRKPQEND